MHLVISMAHRMAARARRVAYALILLFTLGLVIARPTSAQETVYNQPPIFPNSFYSWTSDYDTGGYGNFFITYDNFILASPSVISGLTWQGFTFDDTHGGTSITPSSFTIDFLSNSAGTPGTLLFTQQVAYNSTAVGTTDFFANGRSETIYDYNTSLSSPFIAPANTPLWVSIIGNTALPGAWTWTQGSGGDFQSYQNDYFDSNSGFRPSDRAFSLQSTSEPSALVTFALAGIGLLSLAIFARKPQT